MLSRRVNQVLAARMYGRAVPACIEIRSLNAVGLGELDEAVEGRVFLEHLAGCLHVAGDDEALAGEKPRKHLRGATEQLVVVNEHEVIGGGLT